MVYELQREGRTFHCNSSDVVEALIKMGWSVSVTVRDGRAYAGESNQPQASAAQAPAAHRSDSRSGQAI
jgi:hypothetical protein